MASVPREERAFVASAADALGYDEQRQPTSKQQLAIAAALAILDGRWRHHAESRQVGLAVAAYGVDKKQVNEFLDCRQAASPPLGQHGVEALPRLHHRPRQASGC